MRNNDMRTNEGLICVLERRIERLEKILSSNERETVRKHEQKEKICEHKERYIDYYGTHVCMDCGQRWRT
jgi:hypothetical protein